MVDDSDVFRTIERAREAVAHAERLRAQKHELQLHAWREHNSPDHAAPIDEAAEAALRARLFREPDR